MNKHELTLRVAEELEHLVPRLARSFSASDRDDLIQETQLAMLTWSKNNVSEGEDMLADDPARLRAFVWTIVRHERDRLLGRVRDTQEIPEDTPDPATPEPSCSISDAAELVQLLLQDLGPDSAARETLERILNGDPAGDRARFLEGLRYLRGALRMRLFRDEQGAACDEFLAALRVLLRPPGSDVAP
jgi:DNA-directed RNA polymerase specialized sigma24 family protein